MLYPQSSAYRSETGGLMSALRVLTAEQSESSGDQHLETQAHLQSGNITSSTMCLTT